MKEILVLGGIFVAGASLMVWGLSSSDGYARARASRCAALHGVMIDSTNTCMLGCTAVVTP